MLVDAFDNWSFYYPNNALWKQAFSFLAALTPDSEPTDMVPILEEKMMARVMCYETRAVADAVLEAHDNYVDIQMSLVNTECIDWFPRSALTIKTPYNSDSDAVFFERPPLQPVRIYNQPGMFTVLFPQDAHAPQLMAGNAPETVKKVVVKVRLSALQEG